MSAPQTALLSGTVTWSDGSLFDGWLRLGLVLPQNSDGQWPTTVLAGETSPQRLPIWAEVPISAGAFDANTQILFNSSLNPPNTQYVAYWYDRNNRRLFPASNVNPTPFTISANPYPISIPTLTVPSTSATIPVPVDSPTQGV